MCCWNLTEQLKIQLLDQGHDDNKPHKTCDADPRPIDAMDIHVSALHEEY